MCAFAIVASTTPSTSPAAIAFSGRPEAHDERRDEALQPEQRARVHVDRSARRGDDRRDGREPARETERERDERVDRHADDSRAFGVGGDRLQPAAEARVLERQARRPARARSRTR